MGNERQSAFSGRQPIAQQFTAGTLMCAKRFVRPVPKHEPRRNLFRLAGARLEFPFPFPQLALWATDLSPASPSGTAACPLYDDYCYLTR